MTITTTANDLIKATLKMAGVVAIGQTPLAEDANDVLNLLNSMIASFNQSRYLIWRLQDIATMATGAATYTVGPGGDFDLPQRPTRIQAAYARLVQQMPASSGPVDFPLGNIETYEEYSTIMVKSLKAFPSQIFYDPTLVLGTLHVWPIASDLFELHLILRDRLASFPDLTAPITFPAEYYEALLYNLCGRVQIAYQIPVNPAVVALARAALNTIMVANARTPNLMMPGGLTRVGGGAWPLHGIGGVYEGTFTLNEDTLG